MPCVGGKEDLIAASRAPLHLLIAVQQGLPQLIPIQRLGQIALGVYVIAQQGHVPVGGDEYNVRGIGLLLQMAGQRHAVQLFHDHIQQQEVEMPSALNVREERLSALIGGNRTGDPGLRHDALRQPDVMLQIGLFIVTDGDLIHDGPPSQIFCVFPL